MKQLRFTSPAVIISAVAIIGIGAATYAWFNREKAPAFSLQRVTVSGKLACLPHKNPAPYTAECAAGLRTDSNKYYALVHLPNSASGSTFETSVKITGTYKPADSDSQYDTIGSIDVTSFQKH